MNKVKRFRVKNTPWPVNLPNDTAVVEMKPGWFRREDDKRLFPLGFDKEYDKHMMFRLFDDEVEPLD